MKITGNIELVLIVASRPPNLHKRLVIKGSIVENDLDEHDTIATLFASEFAINSAGNMGHGQSIRAHLTLI
jgi:hypothetical protein